jgi:hypothetical protein
MPEDAAAEAAAAITETPALTAASLDQTRFIAILASENPPRGVT